MKAREQKWRRKGAIEIVEEAVHMLRTAPSSVFVIYYMGGLPFILGLIYFWADMSKSAVADQHCAEMSLFLAILYLWMKCWQAIFAAQLKACIAHHSVLPWSWIQILRLISIQTILQSYAFLLLPMAFLATVPFGWVYAFYHNLSLLGDGRSEDMRTVFRKAWQQAFLWSGQNHILMLIFLLFGMFVFINLGMVLMFIPHLLKTFLGIESTWTLSGMHLLNSTFLAAVCGLSYLCINPLIKAVYVLRCFYGESIHTGEDLKMELHELKYKAVAVSFILFVGIQMSAASDSGNGSVAQRSVSQQTTVQELDRSIEEVIQRPEYAWRFPREKIPKDLNREMNFMERFIMEVQNTIKKWFQPLKQWWIGFKHWLEEWMNKREQNEHASMDWRSSIQAMVFVLLALLASVSAIVFWRMWKKRRVRSGIVLSQPVMVMPDITHEEVQADQLPSDRWQTLAHEFLAKGELRSALRAFYLATLAALAQQEVITIAKFKSNRDYERELKRRARAQTELLIAFSENVTVFENAWYGMHEVTLEIVKFFTVNQERMRVVEFKAQSSELKVQGRIGL